MQELWTSKTVQFFGPPQATLYKKLKTAETFQEGGFYNQGLCSSTQLGHFYRHIPVFAPAFETWL